MAVAEPARAPSIRAPALATRRRPPASRWPKPSAAG